MNEQVQVKSGPIQRSLPSCGGEGEAINVGDYSEGAAWPCIPKQAKRRKDYDTVPKVFSQICIGGGEVYGIVEVPVNSNIWRKLSVGRENV